MYRGVGASFCIFVLTSHLLLLALKERLIFDNDDDEFYPNRLLPFHIRSPAVPVGS